MGYRSYYTLTVDGDKSEEIIRQLRAENEEAKYAFNDDGQPETDTKWYDSDDHMKEFSLKHPGVLFTMWREGEDGEDRGYTYYKDGKMQECFAKITFDEFDESKLK